MVNNISFYDLMDRLDKFCINYQDMDFRELTAHTNKVCGREILFIKDKNGKIIKTFMINTSSKPKVKNMSDLEKRNKMFYVDFERQNKMF